MGRVAALVLAAGFSRRMGGANKLLAPLEGAPVIARVVDAVLASRARPVVVVTGHDAEAVRGALAGRDVCFAHNPAPAEGLSASLRTGLTALEDVDGALVCLGDMPWVRATHIDALLASFEGRRDEPICAPTWQGQRGHPVLWPKRHFAALAALRGDAGGRALIAAHAGEIYSVPVADAGVTLDVDTPEALAALAPANA
jgi:molybdenum cofactor cytidylyltransferase